MVGRALVTTPLLDKPLAGAVYLRSSEHELPDIALDLRGQFDIELVGQVGSTKAGGAANECSTRSRTCRFRRFELNLYGKARELASKHRKPLQGSLKGRGLSYRTERRTLSRKTKRRSKCGSASVSGPEVEAGNRCASRGGRRRSSGPSQSHWPSSRTLPPRPRRSRTAEHLRRERNDRRGLQLSRRRRHQQRNRTRRCRRSPEQPDPGIRRCRQLHTDLGIRRRRKWGRRQDTGRRAAEHHRRRRRRLLLTDLRRVHDRLRRLQRRSGDGPGKARRTVVHRRRQRLRQRRARQLEWKQPVRRHLPGRAGRREPATDHGPDSRPRSGRRRKAEV